VIKMEKTIDKRTMRETIVIDATNNILGRLGARVAKLLLEGYKVVILNAEKAVISGSRKFIFQKYKRRSEIKTRTNPRKGPFFYRRPDLFVKRIIRGMLPFSQQRGRQAFKRLRVYIGEPREFEGIDKVYYSDLNAEVRLRGKFVQVEEISKFLGWKG